jgi:hypothetical protein
VAVVFASPRIVGVVLKDEIERERGSPPTATAARFLCCEIVRSSHSGHVDRGTREARAELGRVMCGAVDVARCVARAARSGIERAARPPSRPREQKDRPASGIEKIRESSGKAASGRSYDSR